MCEYHEYIPGRNCPKSLSASQGNTKPRNERADCSVEKDNIHLQICLTHFAGQQVNRRGLGVDWGAASVGCFSGFGLNIWSLEETCSWFMSPTAQRMQGFTKKQQQKQQQKLIKKLFFSGDSSGCLLVIQFLIVYVFCLFG